MTPALPRESGGEAQRLMLSRYKSTSRALGRWLVRYGRAPDAGRFFLTSLSGGRCSGHERVPGVTPGRRYRQQNTDTARYPPRPVDRAIRLEGTRDLAHRPPPYVVDRPTGSQREWNCEEHESEVLANGCRVRRIRRIFVRRFAESPHSVMTDVRPRRVSGTVMIRCRQKRSGCKNVLCTPPCGFPRHDRSIRYCESCLSGGGGGVDGARDKFNYRSVAEQDLWGAPN